MRTNIARVIELLSAESLRKQNKDGHEIILKAITSTDDPTFAVTTRVALRGYDNDKHRTDEYWIPVFEAYVLGNYDNAHLIVEQFVAQLPKDTYANVSRAYPPLFIALLNVFNWVDRSGDGRNYPFESRLSATLAQLLQLYTQYGSAEINEQNPEIQGWIRARLRSAMDDYFHQHHPEFWNRMGTFCSGIKEVIDTVNGAPEFLRIVAQELTSHMPAQMAARAAADAWLAAKKLNDAKNESLRTRLDN